jgi:5-methylcytosine-specific restriction protein A
MPVAAPTHCPCGGQRIKGVCNRCNKGKRGDHTKSSHQRGYGWDWQQFRRVYLQQHPICEDCKAAGKATAAEELHHKVKIVDAPELRLEPSNVMALCGSCHDKRTARGE